ncbi:ATP-dependent nuclease [Gordonia sp. DT218]|uniref:ATP-dependent nuclease n=1 Tax=Gordonia sp. DT218 TaxID=3416659 RepID=UPI003CEAA7E3
MVTENGDAAEAPANIPGNNALAATWSNGDYEPYIHYIRFPFFKNLATDLRIDFQFPITVLIGANGSNKSSILRALQGCPEGQNIGNYWFGTPLDSVPDDERHRFVHGRWSPSAKRVVEVIQIRRARTSSRTGKSTPDYFETDEPIVRDGMQAMPPAPEPMPEDRSESRWKQIQKKVEYFDFRSEISAFDKYFYHNDFNTRGNIVAQSRQRRDRKELLFEKSIIVRKILDRRLRSYKPGGKQLVIKPAVKLNADSLSWISYILGRRYVEITVVGHRAFKASGTTAMMKTDDLSYSEAWAGSGEFAVVQLVRAVWACEPGTLLLLDEPEVSLHPGAQLRLMNFLRRTALDKKLQIVMSSHSPAIIEGLPPNAIKVLDRSLEGQIFLRSQKSLPSEAFVVLEHSFHKKTIVTEDRLAREIVRHVLRKGGEAKLKSVDVKFHRSGSSVMRSRLLPDWALEGRTDVLLVLDGDKRFELPPESTQIAECDLEAHVKRIMETKSVSRYVPANSGGVTTNDLRTVIDWTIKYVRFLPGGEPDHWLATTLDPSAAVEGNGKSWWDERCRESSGMLAGEYVESDQRFHYQQATLGRVRPSKDNGLEVLANDLDTFIASE